MRVLTFRILSVKRDVFLSWAVTDFTGDAQNEVVATVAVSSSGEMLEPCVMAFHAADGHIAGKVTRTVTIEEARPPFVGWSQPRDRQFE